ncbi:MAG: hypothetical protein FJ096_06985 [Deltaproteobacteria bacterium]|nr:hypothetical protein [Deltaproteobacteria bacterium]
MTALTVCPSCRRHVFNTDEACPHCAERRVAPLVALVVSTGLGLTACAGSEAPNVREAVHGTTPSATVNIEASPPDQVDAPSVAVYGPPPSDAEVRRQVVPEASSSATMDSPPATSPSASPSASASASTSPKPPPPARKQDADDGSSTWRVKKGGVPVPVYGPPPRDPPKRGE